MKYLRMFEAAVGLFPKRIKVTFIDAATGNILGKYKLPAELLPAAFNRPVILEIDNNQWRVLQADPVLADDFLFTKRLTLRVQDAANVDRQLLEFSLPSVCSEWPVIGTHNLFNDFTLEINETDWRQLEFFPLSQSGVIEEAVKIVDVILNSSPKPLWGYDQQYVRDNAFRPGLVIPWSEFCTALVNPVKGNICFNNNGFVKNGFALRSDSYTYYGIQENGFISTLCLSQFEWADDEFMRILSTFELLLVDWCNASRLSAESGEEPKTEFIKI